MIEEQREDKQHTKGHINFTLPEEGLEPEGQIKYFLEDREMKFSPGFCILATVLKFAPIICFFTATEIKILGFTLVLLAASIDFWTLKNITGRQLVNMMWWMKVDLETGEQEWMFLSNEGFITHHINEAVFWGCCLGGCIFWAVTLLLSLILSSLFWISLCFVCLVLNVLNFIFFMRCRGNHRQKFMEFADKVGLPSAKGFVDMT